MRNEITAVIFRFDPDKDREPWYQEYRVDAREEISVLGLVTRVHDEVDPTLSFRSYCCGLQMCGSCVMKIDGKKKFACLTLVRPGEKVTIEPVGFPEGHIRDLVVKMKEQEPFSPKRHEVTEKT